MAAAAKPANFKLAFKKETPRTVVYEDSSGRAPITSVYVQKLAMPDGEVPASITLTLAFG